MPVAATRRENETTILALADQAHREETCQARAVLQALRPTRDSGEHDAMQGRAAACLQIRFGPHSILPSLSGAMRPMWVADTLA